MSTSSFIRRETAKGRRDVRGLEDLVTTPRCPCCRAFLIARLGKAGPYFACRCPRPPRRPAPAQVQRRAA